MGNSGPAPSYKWYVDWNASPIPMCVQDCDTSEGGSCGGPASGAWTVRHGSPEACCNAHMSHVTLLKYEFTG